MIRFLLATLLFFCPLGLLKQDPTGEEAAPEPAQAGEATASSEGVAEAGAQAAAEEATTPEGGEADKFKPRYELYVPSVECLVRRAGESHAGALIRHASGLFSAQAAGGRGFTEEDWRTLWGIIRTWPDTSLGLATYAPTAEGKARWIVQLVWPLADLHERVSKILEMVAAEDVLEGVVLAGRGEGGYELTVGETTLAVMLADDKEGSLIVSDAEVARPTSLYGQDAEWTEPPKKTATLVYSRFNIAGTEKDTGALFGAQIPWVKSIRYQASVRSEGEWSERFGVSWNVLVGTTAKAAIKHAKRGFYVPREAFGSALISSPVLQGMLDAMAGLKPGTLMGEMGGLTGDRVGPETCFILLPGTGILPFPDLVIQTRVRYTSAVLEDIRQAITKANQERAKDDLVETWHEIEEAGRTVFYDDGRAKTGAGLQPALYRRVIFVDERADPKGRSRSFLTIAFTSTDVEGMVGRWTAPRAEKDRVALAAGKKVDGRGWLNWRQLYDHLHLWANLGIAGIDPLAVLPPTEAVEEHLTDATLTVKAKFTGLLIRHRGPVPAGALYLPFSLFSTLAPDDSGSTDLSRERIACDRLKLLHKNAELFKKDVGRWPARVAELDGYIDFAGNPWMLRLRQSTRSAWRKGFTDMLAGPEEEGEGEDADEETDIDDSIYVIEWDGTRWILGLKPGLLDHLEKLYVDQDGEIHRVVKSASAEAAEPEAPAEQEQAS